MNEETYDFFSIKRVTKKFLEVSCCSRAKQRQRNVQKKVCCSCKVASLLIRPLVVFHCSPALPLPLSITRFYLLFEQTINIIESFAFALAKSIYYYYNKPNPYLRSALIHSTDIPIHGRYSRWSYWGRCSRSCGGGIRYRYRYCNNPTPQNNVRNCSGPVRETEERRCNTRIKCPGKQLD